MFGKTMKLAFHIIGTMVFLGGVGMLVSNYTGEEDLQILALDTPYQQIQQSIVRVQTKQGHGTGTIMTKDGLVMTCAHVVGTFKVVQIGIWNDKTKQWMAVPGVVVTVDHQADLAVVRLPEGNWPAIEIGSVRDFRGEDVRAIGQPRFLPQIMVKGIVANFGPMPGEKDPVTGDLGAQRNVMLLDISIYPGHSGSPVLDSDGKMIGVIYATLLDYNERIALAVPLADVIKLLNVAKKLAKKNENVMVPQLEESVIN